MGTAREGDSKPRRAIRRGHEACRLEEQLWVLVFEELWPVVSRSTRRKRDGGGESAESGRATAFAEGA
jgi:hypothetical protein